MFVGSIAFISCRCDREEHKLLQCEWSFFSSLLRSDFETQGLDDSTFNIFKDDDDDDEEEEEEHVEENVPATVRTSGTYVRLQSPEDMLVDLATHCPKGVCQRDGGGEKYSIIIKYKGTAVYLSWVSMFCW